MSSEVLSVAVPGGRVAVERWAGEGPTVVLLHAGVVDRRAWAETASRLAPAYAVVAYDRRGFGDSPVGREPFRHIDDLRAVLDAVGADEVWLVGSSQGGKVALDATLTYPDRVAGLILLAPAVSGAPNELEADPETERLDAAVDAALTAGDLTEANRLEAWLLLDGPAGPEGRVAGRTRELFLEMNAIVLRSDAESEATGNSEVEAWSRLAEITGPVTIAWGELDIAVLNERCRELVQRLPDATGHALPGVAHLPYLEDPGAVADLIARSLRGAR